MYRERCFSAAGSYWCCRICGNGKIRSMGAAYLYQGSASEVQNIRTNIFNGERTIRRTSSNIGCAKIRVIGQRWRIIPVSNRIVVSLNIHLRCYTRTLNGKVIRIFISIIIIYAERCCAQSGSTGIKTNLECGCTAARSYRCGRIRGNDKVSRMGAAYHYLGTTTASEFQIHIPGIFNSKSAIY